jgi:transposase
VLSLSSAVKLWFCPDPVDMRLGFDGLHNLVRSRLDADPLGGHLFLFTNRRRDRVKVLYWSGHGLCLWCQRLESGRYHFPAPRPDKPSIELSAAQFLAILDGIDLDSAKRFKRFEANSSGNSAT